MLKNSKVPGASVRTRAAEAPGAGPAAGFLGESQAGLCERPGTSLDQGGLNRKYFSKRKRENRGTPWLVRELSAAAMASCALTPQPLDREHGKSSPSTHLKPGWRAPRSEDWAPTTETLGGCAPCSTTQLPERTDPKRPSGCITQSVSWDPHPKPQVGMHLDQWPGCPQLKPRVGVQPTSDLLPWLHRPEVEHQCASRSATQLPGAQTQSAWVGSHLDQLPGRQHLKPRVGAHPIPRVAAPSTGPKPGIGLQPDQQPGFPRATTPKSTHLAPAHRALQGLLAL